MSAGLRRSDRVQVRSAAEILATLDADGALEAVPFMAEMVAWCGQSFTVEVTADRMCDTIHWTGTRRVPDAVMLPELRCDGSGHDGCQTECRPLWKSAWLRKLGPNESAAPAPADEAARERLVALVASKTRAPAEPGAAAPPHWRCQLTEMYRASGPASHFPYLEELANGNVAPSRYLRVLARALVWETERKLGRRPRHCFPGTATPVQRPPLSLRPGEWVRIRSAAEIEETIDLKGGTRGLWFDYEMLQFCGKTFRVRDYATRFIHDDGRFIALKSAAVKLESVTCKGDYSVGRWFCPRALHPYWREDWLERAPHPESGT